EARLEDPLVPRDEQVMDHSVAEVGGEDLSRLCAVRHEADRSPGSVGVLTKLALKLEEPRLSVDLEGEGVHGVSLVAAAGVVLPPEAFEGIEVGAGVRADHEPVRTARTWLLLVLLLLFTLPLLKFTFHALSGLLAFVDADQ